ncbi:MAG: dihydroorotate dehydrogenase electron transfer subunit [Selenomonadaceae bacterium]|nr:dihydroorotate dehydrogenase electron transfer subunit [Selenomonadaceae bacterium]
MIKNFTAEILSNEAVADKIYRLIVAAEELAEISRAGQFVQVKISDEFTLRRPLGIASAADGRVKIFYRTVGRGTENLSTKKVGESLSILGALGNGFTPREGKVLLVGGGMGLAPLLCAAEQFTADVLIGGRTNGEVNFWCEEFRKHVGEIFLTTDDGSVGTKGFVTDLMPKILSGDYCAVLTCGPEIMMRGVAKIAAENNLPCEVSFEKRMACGLGACLSCSIDTVDGRKKVCKDGPVFNADKVFGGVSHE